MSSKHACVFRCVPCQSSTIFLMTILCASGPLNYLVYKTKTSHFIETLKSEIEINV